MRRAPAPQRWQSDLQIPQSPLRRRTTLAHQGRRQPTIEVTVERGDTLWSIAERHLGAGERWREIAELNRGREMVDGSTFDDARTIQPAGRCSCRQRTGTPAEQAVVTVERGRHPVGDRRRGVRRRHRVAADLRANDDQIEDPDLIYPGQRLDIPGQRVCRAAEASRPASLRSAGFNGTFADGYTVDGAEPRRRCRRDCSRSRRRSTVCRRPTRTPASTSTGRRSPGPSWAAADSLLPGCWRSTSGRRRTQSRNRRSGKAAPTVGRAPAGRRQGIEGHRANRRASAQRSSTPRFGSSRDLCEREKLELPETAAARHRR